MFHANDILFPAVTLCNNNPLKRSLVRKYEALDKILSGHETDDKRRRRRRQINPPPPTQTDDPTNAPPEAPLEDTTEVNNDDIVNSEGEYGAGGAPGFAEGSLQRMHGRAPRLSFETKLKVQCNTNNNSLHFSSAK